MTDAPKRIWTDYFMANKLFLAFSDPPVNEFNDCRDEYILAAEHERLLSEARNKALEEAAKVANDKSHWAECPEWLLSGIDAYRQRVVTAIRAMKS